MVVATARSSSLLIPPRGSRIPAMPHMVTEHDTAPGGSRHRLVSRVPWGHGASRLGCGSRNIVPVRWVSVAMTAGHVEEKRFHVVLDEHGPEPTYRSSPAAPSAAPVRRTARL